MRLILKTSLAAALSVSIPAAACRSGPSIDTSKFTVEIRGDVRLVHNHAPQFQGASPVRFEHIGTIGRLEAREEKDVLYDPVDVERLANGDVLVLEGDGCTIKRFDGRHQFVSSFGRKGLGPGDFISPFRLRMSSKKDLVYVAERNRVSWFRPDGRFVGSFKCAAARSGGSSISQQHRTSGMSLLSDGRVILPGDHSVWEESGQAALLMVYDAAGKTVRSFGTVTRFDDPLLTLNANLVQFVTDDSDACYVAYDHQNRLDKYSREGHPLFSSDRPLPYAVKTEMREEVFTSGSMKQAFPWPSVTSVARGVSIDGRGRVWVLTYLVQPNRFGGFDAEDDAGRCYRFDVFDSEGVLRFSVSPPNVPFGGFVIHGDRMYLIDAADEACVREFRIIEGD